MFSQPTGCTGQSPCNNPGLGNTGRNQFRGPGYIQDNFSIFKRFTVYRETALEIRVDAFQLSNTPQFGQPNVAARMELRASARSRARLEAAKAV